MSRSLASVRPAASALARAQIFATPKRAEHDRHQKRDEEVWHAYHPLPHTVRPNTPLWRQLHPLDSAHVGVPEVNPKVFGYDDPWKQYHPLVETVRSKAHHYVPRHGRQTPSSKSFPWGKNAVGTEVWRQMHPLVNTVKPSRS